MRLRPVTRQAMRDHGYYQPELAEHRLAARPPPPAAKWVLPPMTMLRRFDRVLAPTKAKLEVDAEADRLALGVGWAC